MTRNAGSRTRVHQDRKLGYGGFFSQVRRISADCDVGSLFSIGSRYDDADEA